MPTVPWRAGALAPTAIGLTLFVVNVQLRMDDPWADGVLLLVALVPAALLLFEGLGARREDGIDRAAVTVLLVGGLVLAGIAIVRLAQVLGSEDVGDSGGTLVWTLLLFTALAVYCHLRSRTVATLLIASLAGVGLLLATVHWVFQTDDIDVYRALLTLSFVVLFGAGIAGEGRSGTILIGAAGVTVLAMAYATGLLFLISPDGGGGGVGWGWELVTLVQGAALAVYAVQRLEPGPGYLAFFVLALFAISAATSDDATLIGWPLALAILTGLTAAWGLRAADPAG